MALGKLLKGGSLVLAGVLLGGLLSYDSRKDEIVKGINDISSMAIQYKNDVGDLTASLNSAQETVRNLTETKTTLENEKVSLEAQLKELVSQGNADATEIANLKAKIEEKDAEIKKLKDMIAFKDMLLQTTYEKAMELEGKVEDLTKQLEASKNDSQSLLDKANEEIEKANQDQVDILNAVNQAKEEINK